MNIIPIITGNSCKAGMADLNQLSFCELARVVFIVVIISVSLLQSLKLVTHQALESLSKNSSWQRGFTDTSNKEINIIYILVNLLQPFNNFFVESHQRIHQNSLFFLIHTTL